MNPSEEKIKRKFENRIIGGVTGGLSDYFKIDILWVRLLFIVLLMMGGGGALIYLILWIAIPNEDYQINETMEMNQNQNPRRNEGNIVTGILLIVFGFMFLIMQYFPEIDFRDLWPYILIIVGVFLLIKGFRFNK